MLAFHLMHATCLSCLVLLFVYPLMEGANDDAPLICRSKAHAHMKHLSDALIFILCLKDLSDGDSYVIIRKLLASLHAAYT
jgi:hypothetical protein